MTIVEFFDKDAIENIVSSLMCNPENVVLIGDNKKAMKRAIEKYKAVIEKHGTCVNFSVVQVQRNNLQDIVGTLQNLIETLGEITIDLTGGEDLHLVAAGIVFNSNPSKVFLHRYNINNGKFYDCDADGNVLSSTKYNISVEDSISLYGGDIVFEDKQTETKGTYKWNFDKEFRTDIDTMWQICSDNPREWNRITNICTPEYYFDDFDLKIHSQGKFLTSIPVIIQKLKSHKLINNVTLKNGTLSFESKNPQIKRCLTTAGQILELKTTLSLLSINEANNGNLFNDILTGVTIQWELPEENNAIITNEIDVIVIKELVPFFISCKNGDVEAEEFYKLSTIATKFGGKYAKKILVATEEITGLTQRATEMHIRVVDNVGKSKNFTKQLKTFL